MSIFTTITDKKQGVAEARESESSRSLLIALVFGLAIAGVCFCFWTVGWGNSVLAISFLFTGLVLFFLNLFGFNSKLYFWYILILPVLAGFDRYKGDVLYEVPGWIARLGTTQGVLIAVMLFLVVSEVINTARVVRGSNWLHGSVLLFFVVTTISIFYGPSEELITEFYLSNIPFYFAAYLAARAAVKSQKDAELLGQAMVGCVGIVVLSRFLYQEINLTSRIDVNYIFGGAVNYSQVLVLVLPFSFLFAHIGRLVYLRRIFASCFILILIDVVLSQTRGAYLAAFLSMMYLLRKTRLVRFSPGAVVSIVVIGIVAISILEFRAVSEKDVFEGSNEYRLEQITSYVEIFKAQAITGLGFGAEWFVAPTRSGSHNTLVSIAVDTGLIGVSAFLLIFFFGFRFTRQLRTQNDANCELVLFLRACEASLIAQLIHANTTGNEILYNVPMQILFFLFAIVAVIESLHRHHSIATT